MEMVPLPRFAAKAFTSSAAGGVRLEARSRNTIVADVPADGAGIGVATTGAAGGGEPAAAGRGGGPAGSAGDGPVGSAGDEPAEDTPEFGGTADVAGAAEPAVVVAGAVAAGAGAGVAAPGPGGSASSGALCTALRGAGDGAVAADGAAAGAVTAGMEALATGVPGEPVPAAGALARDVVPGGGGGGAVPTPNKVGEAAGEDGSANGADWAACWALVRSATSESVSFFSSSLSGGSGLAGTVEIFG
jgi:hypothetical protein